MTEPVATMTTDASNAGATGVALLTLWKVGRVELPRLSKVYRDARPAWTAPPAPMSPDPWRFPSGGGSIYAGVVTLNAIAAVSGAAASLRPGGSAKSISADTVDGVLDKMTEVNGACAGAISDRLHPR
jgi:hypothetical protein